MHAPGDVAGRFGFCGVMRPAYCTKAKPGRSPGRLAPSSVPGFSYAESTSYTAVDLGAGCVVNRTPTLQPSVSIPIDLDGGKATFHGSRRASRGRQGLG
jgi:hypothetical protein